MSDKKAINLGNIVEDEVTGLTGTASQILEHMNGTRQIAIQPKGDGRTIPETVFVDDYLVNYVKDGVADRVPAIDKTSFVMGQEVREMASGQVGTITSRVVYLNGCVHFGITTKSTENKAPDMFYVDHKRLELVSEGIKDKVKTTDTGGPMIRGPLNSR
jgi:hypothetical protein